MKKSEIIFPEFYDRYINLVPEEDLLIALQNGLQTLENLDILVLQKLEQIPPYAEGKWTINQVIQHILDWERIFTYRALIFARNIESSVGLDENFLADHSFAHKPIENILEDLISARKSTISMFKNFCNEELQKNGLSGSIEISVAAIGFNMVGHQIHHFNVINERYLPLLKV